MNRFIEILLCLCALVFAFPFFVFAALLTLLTLGRPVFSRKRVQEKAVRCLSSPSCAP